MKIEHGWPPWFSCKQLTDTGMLNYIAISAPMRYTRH